MILSTRLLAATLATLGALGGCRQPPPASPGLIVHSNTPRPWAGFLVVVDSTVFSLDDADDYRRADTVARLLRGRVIDSVRVIPPQQATALYGSRAVNGVLHLWLRP